MILFFVSLLISSLLNLESKIKTGSPYVCKYYHETTTCTSYIHVHPAVRDFEELLQRHAHPHTHTHTHTAEQSH